MYYYYIIYLHKRDISKRNNPIHLVWTRRSSSTRIYDEKNYKFILLLPIYSIYTYLPYTIYIHIYLSTNKIHSQKKTETSNSIIPKIAHLFRFVQKEQAEKAHKPQTTANATHLLFGYFFRYFRITQLMTKKSLGWRRGEGTNGTHNKYIM